MAPGHDITMDGRRQLLTRAFNMLSLIGGILLLVSISGEILYGEPRSFSSGYMWLQFAVCLVFCTDFLLRMSIDVRPWRFFLYNFWFLLLSIPYLNIIEWLDLHPSRSLSMYVAAIPLLRSFLALYVVIRWWLRNKVQKLFWAYIFTVVEFTYLSALMFYDFEREVNPAIDGFGDAMMWACMNLTTLGTSTEAVTILGKVLTIMLPIFGMLLFPVFTAYVVQRFTGNGATGTNAESAGGKV